MTIQENTVRSLVKALYIAAATIFVINLLSQTLLFDLAYSPSTREYSATLASALSGLVTLLQKLTIPPVSTIFAVSGLILQLTVLKDMKKQREDTTEG